MNRRELLQAGIRGGLALGIAKAIHNTTVGYGHFGVGENLTTQNLDSLVAEHLSVSEYFRQDVGEYEVYFSNGTLRYLTSDGQRLTVGEDETPAPVAAFARDHEDIRSGAIEFSFSGPDVFFATLADANMRPATVELLRGGSYTRANPAVVESFANAPPTDTEALVAGLAEGFRTHSRYDIQRYLAGSIDDNLIPLDVDLREPFRPPEAFEPLMEGDETIGLFCGELTRLANRAVRSVPAAEQSIPLYGLYVRNRRNKHAYNAFGTVRRSDDGQLELPITFVDYTHTTLYDDLRLTGVLGDGFDAYDEWHRADEIIW